MASNEEIHTWIERLLKGDEEAFEFIFNLTSQRIYETVFAIVKNRHDTNEIVNEIYFQLWKSISTYDQSRPFLFWLNGIVYKQISQWRKHIWKRMRLFEKQQLSDDSVVEVPEKVLLRKETEEQLLTVIQELPFKFRVVIVYRFYHDYKYEEIAELLQIPIGTVRSRIHRALEKIRNQSSIEIDEEESNSNVVFK